MLKPIVVAQDKEKGIKKNIISKRKTTRKEGENKTNNTINKIH